MLKPIEKLFCCLLLINRTAKTRFRGKIRCALLPKKMFGPRKATE